MDNEKKQVQYDTHYIANRMARTIGHVRLVRSMVECDADCTEVLIEQFKTELVRAIRK